MLHTPTLNQTLSNTLATLLTDIQEEVVVLHGISGLVHFVSHNARRVLGGDVVTVGCNLVALTEGDDAGELKHVLLSVSQGQAGFVPLTVRFHTPSGLPRWVAMYVTGVKDATGRVIELHTTLRDITQQISVRDSILDQDRLSRMTNVLAKVGGWFWDADSTQLYLSPEAKLIHEAPPDLDFTPDVLTQFIPAPHLERINQARQETLQTGALTTVDVEAWSATGKHQWLRMYLSVEGDSTCPTRVYVATLDITEHVVRQQELECVIQELNAYRSHMEEFGDLVSHQLRAPVANLRALTLLLEKPTSDVEETEIKHALRDTIEVLERTVQEVAEVVQVRLSTVPIPENIYLLDAIVRLKARMADEFRKHDAKIEIAAGSGETLNFPPAYLDTILRQLASNALQFATTNCPPRIRIALTFKDDHAVLEVSDNGQGLDVDLVKDRIFRHGKTFHRTGSRRGVGLFTIRTLVESLGGSISVTSQPGEGARFLLDLGRHTVGNAQRTTSHDTIGAR